MRNEVKMWNEERFKDNCINRWKLKTNTNIIMVEVEDYTLLYKNRNRLLLIQ